MPPSFGFLLLAVGALLLALSIPLYRERIPMNRWYGFRTPRTTHDERVWFPTNRVMGRNMALGSLAMMLAGLGAVASGGLLPATAWVLMGVVPLLLGLVHGFVWASAFVGDLDAGRARPVADRLPTDAPANEARSRATRDRQHS